jgi:hypothetical protein
METGKIEHYPETGGAMVQDEWLLMMLLTAWRVWYIHEYKQRRQLPVTAEDHAFTDWFLPQDWRPGNGRQET